MGFKRWTVQNNPDAEKMASEHSINPFVAQILGERKVSIDDLYKDNTPLGEALESPFALADMQKAVDRIHMALDAYEKIVIYGDYDCDGITSTVILYTYLSNMGANVDFFIPEREAGYGMNRQAVDHLKEQGTQLIITVDNGITAIDEIKYAGELEIDVIVTDHHQPLDELPPAAAVVDPHRKDCPSAYKYIAGVGVAFKLIAALEEGDYETAFEYCAEFVTIGTIGDIVELTGENRSLVKNGLRYLNMTDNIGLLALMQAAGFEGKELDSQSVAFGIAPRINAVGRLGSASRAVELFLCEDPEQAEELAQEINALNAQRKKIEDTILQDIERVLQKHPEKLNQRVMVLWGENWNHGVIGIVSSRILERYGKPNILLSIEGEQARGSARSVGDFSLFEAIKSCEHLLERFGGHTLAAGVTLHADNLEAFEEGILSYAKANHDKMPAYTYVADSAVEVRDITVENVQSLQLLEPYGAGNHAPVFMISNVAVEKITPLSGDKHLRIQFGNEKGHFWALYFKMSTKQFVYKTGQHVDILASLDINEFRGSTSVSVKIKDIRPCAFPQEKYFAAKDTYERLKREEPVDSRLKQRILPNRKQVGVLYKYLHKLSGFDQDIDMLYIHLMNSGLNYCKFRVILDILHEVNLITVSPLLNQITINNVTEKVNLSDSAMMKSLQCI